MEHADTAHLAAVVGALGAALVLVARGRPVLVAGFVLLAVAEAELGFAVTGGHVSSATAAAGAAALVAGLVPIGLVAAAFVRSPALVVPLAVAAAPFRVPLDFNRKHRFYVTIAEGGRLGRLLPLYVVLAAASLALLYHVLRGAPVPALPAELAYPAAGFLGLAAVSLAWSQDLEAGANLLAFFLFPFAALVAVVGRAEFRPWTTRALAAIALSLTGIFAVLGLWQAVTHRLLFFAPNLEVANAYTSYFRVTSLFRDPSLYGRHIVLGICVALVAVWLGRLSLPLATGLAALLFAGLYFSYSQSSFAALFVAAAAIAIAAGDRRARTTVVITASVIALVGAGFVAVAASGQSPRKATSDRSRRIVLTARVFVHHPLRGVGLGGQPTASRALATRHGATPHFVSHTTPLTVAAELGVLGIAAYAALLAGAARLLDRVRRRNVALGLGLGACFLALFVHALAYSGFFEDPITWLILAIAASFLGMRMEQRLPTFVRKVEPEPVRTP